MENIVNLFFLIKTNINLIHRKPTTPATIIPAILGAVVLEIPELGSLTSPFAYYIAGMIVAGVVGFLCIKFMLVLIKKNKFTIFSIYCLCAGILAIVGYFVM